MLHFEEALEIVQRNTNTIGCVRLPMIQALNHVLAEDLMSDIDIPPFNKAAMDGYACRKQDIRVPMEIIEEIPAGSVPLKRIMQGQCSRRIVGE
jgi:molybdopterin molybdotransferase